jgi:hypothetical protein
MNMRATLPLTFALTAFALSPAVAHADVPNCDPPSVSIASPQDGATFEGDPAEVTVKVGVVGGEELRNLLVEAEGVEAAAMAITSPGDYDLVVQLAPGSHTLQATAEDDCGGPGRSDTVGVTVTAPHGSDGDDGHSHDSDGDDGHSHDSDGDKSDEKDDGGCSVSRTPNRTIIGSSAFLLAIFGAWRLRRGQQRNA